MSVAKKVGWIGTGVMGSSMAAHLLDAGYALTVFNHTKKKAEQLLSRGAVWAHTPAEVAENSDIVFTMVGFPSDVQEVILGKSGVLEGMKKGGIVVDMTTSSPELAKMIAIRADDAGSESLDAPVTGGDIGAKNATLSIFVGGSKKAFQAVKPLFEKMGKLMCHCGLSGTGQLAKLANQVAVAGVMFSVCESLLFAQEAGLDLKKWLEAVIPGAAGSAAMNTLGHRLLNLDYSPGFFVDHFVKDLGLCIDECHRMNLVLPNLILAEEFYRMLQAKGDGKAGTQALVKCIAECSGTEWHGR